MGKDKMYTTIIREQVELYRKANKKERGEIISHLCSITGRRRDSISRTLRIALGYNKQTKLIMKQAGTKKPLAPRRPGRPCKYPKEIDAALEYIWESYNYPCAERLIEVIPEAIKISKRDREWKHNDEINSLEVVHPRKMIIAT